MTRTEWLASLKVGDLVAVHVSHACIDVTRVKSASRTLITTGKYAKKANWRRKDGKIAGHRPLGHLFRLEQP